MSEPHIDAKLGVAPELWLGPIIGPRRLPAPAPWGWLGEAARAGYAGVELCPGLPEDPRELGPLLADHGLVPAIVPVVGGLLELTLHEEQRRLAPSLALALGTGCRLLAYTDFTRSARHHDEVALVDRPKLRRDDLRRYGEKLTRLADWLAAEGMALAYQPRLGTCLSSAAELDLLLESSDVTVGFVLDTGPLAFEGGAPEPAGLIGRHKGRLRHVRLQGLREPMAERARARSWGFPRLVREGAFTVPGEETGTLDLAAIRAGLAEAAYEGWVVAAAERAPESRSPREEAEMALETMRGLLAPGGKP